MEETPGDRAVRKNQPLFLPFTLTAVIVLFDQLSKAFIVSRIEMYRVGWSFLGGFLRIIHARNLGSAFSMGNGLPETVRKVVFLALPVVLLVILMFYYFRSRELTAGQRWAIAGILGGGIGNLLDRFFRKDGVVDFIDVRIFGFLGMERWPTFNIADSSVVLGCIFLVITFLLQERKLHEQKS